MNKLVLLSLLLFIIPFGSKAQVIPEKTVQWRELFNRMGQADLLDSAHLSHAEYLLDSQGALSEKQVCVLLKRCTFIDVKKLDSDTLCFLKQYYSAVFSLFPEIQVEGISYRSYPDSLWSVLYGECYQLKIELQTRDSVFVLTNYSCNSDKYGILSNHQIIGSGSSSEINDILSFYEIPYRELSMRKNSAFYNDGPDYYTRFFLYLSREERNIFLYPESPLRLKYVDYDR